MFALTYGAESDWVQNVLAAGGCVIETRRRRITLVDPERFADPPRGLVPIPARWMLRLLSVNDFIAMFIATEGPALAGRRPPQPFARGRGPRLAVPAPALGGRRRGVVIPDDHRSYLATMPLSLAQAHGAYRCRA